MKLIGPFKQLLTMNGLPLRGALPDKMLEIIPDGGIIVNEGVIVATGNFDRLKIAYQPALIEFISGNYVALPGFIDSHTHICWAGSRAGDYALRLSGKTYLEIADQGGGIWNTVLNTRSASLEELALNTEMRANKLLRQGITTIEVKSGYGLSVNQELKLLEAIHKANIECEADLIPTCLAAHIIPKDFSGTETEYLEHLLNELLPEVLKRNLSKRVDIFVDHGAFSTSSAKEYLLKAKEIGFQLTLHGDQFAAGVASIANEVGALSIDHLEAADELEIAILARGTAIPIALPGSSIGLGEPFAPARKLLDAGTSLAIASDWNPGTAPMGNLIVQSAIIGAKEKLTIAEILAAITFRAAAALNLYDRGILKSGNLADLTAYKTDDFNEILYQQGQLQPELVWKKGLCVIDVNK